MTNEVTVSGNGNQIDPFEQYGEEVASRAHITGHLLRFTKHGEWKYGQDMDELPENTRLLAYLPGLKRGWVKWADGAPTRHIVGLVAEGYTPPPREELGDMDESEWSELNGRPIDPWQATNYMIMLDDEGEFYTFVTSSKGGLSAVGELATNFGKHRRMKPDEIPVVELRARSYQHKDYGETFAPVLKLVGWAKIPENFAELEAAMREGEQPLLEAPKAASAPAPKATVKTAPKPAAKPAPAKKNGPGRKVKF
jgi:hypothetical protein